MDERHAGGLWCHQVLEHLDTLVEGTLDDKVLAKVREHVAVCSECAAFGDAYARLVRALQTGPDQALDEARLQRLQRRLAASE